MPRLTAAFLVITLASVGLPGMNGFIGEFLIMLGAFRWDPRFVVVAGLGVILSAVYMLWMFQRGLLRRGHQRREQPPEGPERPRVGGRRPAVRAVDRHGRGAQPVPGADGAGGDPHRAAAGGARADARRRRLARVVLGAPRAGRGRDQPQRRGASRCSTAPSTPSSRSSASRWPASSPCWPRRSARRASGCRSAAWPSSAWSAPASPRCCSGTATPPASAWSRPTTSRCS